MNHLLIHNAKIYDATVKHIIDNFVFIRDVALPWSLKSSFLLPFQSLYWLNTERPEDHTVWIDPVATRVCLSFFV